MSLSVGDVFDSFSDVEKAMERLEREQCITYWRRDSRTLETAKKNIKSFSVDEDIAKRLKYHSLRYTCIRGGRVYKSRATNQRPNQSSCKEACSAFVQWRVTKDVQQLEVMGMSTKHNHPVSKEAFKYLPKQRLLNKKVLEELSSILRSKSEKKVDERIRKTRKEVTLSDLTNKSKKIKRKSGSPEYMHRGLDESDSKKSECKKECDPDKLNEGPLYFGSTTFFMDPAITTQVSKSTRPNEEHPATAEQETRDSISASSTVKLEPEKSDECDNTNMTLEAGRIVYCDLPKSSEDNALSSEEKDRLAWQVAEDLVKELTQFDTEEFCQKLVCLKTICRLWKDGKRVRVTEVADTKSHNTEVPQKKRKRKITVPINTNLFQDVKKERKVPEEDFESYDDQPSSVTAYGLDLRDFMTS